MLAWRDSTTWVKSAMARCSRSVGEPGDFAALRHRLQRQLDGRLAERGEQIGLAAEMRVDERLGDAEFRGDVVERGAGEAALIEQLDRLFENTLALVGQYLLAHRPVIHCPARLC